MDKLIFEFAVLWKGWECDSVAWVMERPDGTRYLRMTSHGAEYDAEVTVLNERIAEYEKVLVESRKVLALLSHNVTATNSRWSGGLGTKG